MDMLKFMLLFISSVKLSLRTGAWFGLVTESLMQMFQNCVEWEWLNDKNTIDEYSYYAPSFTIPIMNLAISNLKNIYWMHCQDQNKQTQKLKHFNPSQIHPSIFRESPVKEMPACIYKSGLPSYYLDLPVLFHKCSPVTK